MNDDGVIRLAIPVNDDDHVRGPADAPVTLVEYGDFECPFCGVAAVAVHDLARRYPAALRVVFRNFPLAMHPHAQAAAEAAEFAAESGRFWEMHDLLYAHQRELDVPHLLGYASQLGLDAAALGAALRLQTYRPIVEESKEGGEESEIPGTPALFLNGVLFEEEPTVENLAHAVTYLVEHGGAA